MCQCPLRGVRAPVHQSAIVHCRADHTPITTHPSSVQSLSTSLNHFNGRTRPLRTPLKRRRQRRSTLNSEILVLLQDVGTSKRCAYLVSHFSLTAARVLSSESRDFYFRLTEARRPKDRLTAPNLAEFGHTLSNPHKEGKGDVSKPASPAAS